MHNSVIDRMGQYGIMQILYSIFLPEYQALPVSPAYSHNFLRVHDAAGENKICKKIKESRRIQDTHVLPPILLIGTAVSNMIPLTWWILVAGMVEAIGGLSRSSEISLLPSKRSRH